MPTATQSKNGAATFESAFGQFKDFNEQFMDAARKAGHMYVDSYEKAVDRAIDLELKVADATQVEWIKNLIDTQADVARELTASYTTTARSLLK